MTTHRAPIAADALLGLLFPFWQMVIGVFVVAVLVLGVRRLASRGPSRMATALMVSGAAVVAVVGIGYLLQAH